MSDLVSGRYYPQELIWRVIGEPANASNSSIPVRTNLGLLGNTAGITDTAGQATKKGVASLIPVAWGDVITKISVLIGGTKGATGKSAFGLWEGGVTEATAGLIGSSTKAAGEVALAAESFVTVELEKAVLITPSNAPSGYIYAGFAQESAEIGTQLASTTPPVIFNKVLNKGFAKAALSLGVVTTVKGAGESAAKLAVETATTSATIYFLQ